ncbi:PD-(D/E)XK nuclease family protein [Alcanivorax sp. DG881]|uniref:PDDEXK-like family protein n=1 Tax=Alcanivorax sp. DG881 TaxID=236097 RepID=UPI0002E4DAE5|nr:PD-(D/E)XK nuclease family protein [Alcanivorax sp. DG881]
MLSRYDSVSEWFWKSDLCERLRGAKPSKPSNVLSLLFSAHDEVRLHTPMIGWLLDPQGDHGLGMEPLTRFLERLGAPIPDACANQSVSVWRERYFPGYGRVDLIVEYQGRAIVIENKLYAADQEAQLSRYQQVLDELICPEPGSLYYLTIDGSEPSDVSCAAPEGQQGDHRAPDYHCISYCSDILGWLVELISEVSEENSRVRHSLEQYLEIVMEVTGMHSRKDAMEELKQSGLLEHIRRNPGDAAVLAGLTRSVRFLHAKLLEDLVNAVQERLKSESSLVSVENAARKDRLDWSVYEAWAGGKTAKGTLLFKVQSVSDPALQNVHLLIGLDAADMFWVGLGHFVDGEHQDNVVSGDRFGVIPGHNSNQWWLSWVTIKELDPAAFDGADGVGRLAVDQSLAELVERVLGVCRQYLAILDKEA